MANGFVEPPFQTSPSDTTTSITEHQSTNDTEHVSMSTSTPASADLQHDNITIKKVRIDNLGCATDTEELFNFLGLNRTLFLQRTCSVQLQEENGSYYAIASVPEFVFTELLNMDGVEFMGRSLHLRPNDGYAAAVGQDEQVELQKKCVEIDMTHYFTCYDVKNLNSAMVAQAVAQSFHFDETKKLIPSWDKITWKIDTKHPEMYENITTLKLDGKEMGHVSVKVEKQIVRADGKVITVRRKEKDEILITLVGANTTDFEGLKEAELYGKIVAMGIGSIKRGLSVQYNENSEVPNGNLFFVLKGLKPGDLDKLPNFFVFGSNKMFLRWKGKPRKCYFCQKMHSGVCQMEQLVRKMEQERDSIRADNNGSFKMKVYTNSTLRYVNQKALACNVDAMSGAQTGNLLNAIEIDEEVKDVQNIILVSGQNELSPRMRKDEFLWAQKKKKERVLELADSKKVAILSLPKQDYVNSEGQARDEVWRANLNSLSDKVTIWENPLPTYDDDDGSHPSEKQTGQLVRYLGEKCAETFGESLILSSATEDVLCSSRMYRGVNSLYKYGCAACPRKDRNRWFGLCDVCKQEMEGDSQFQEEVNFFDQRVQEWNNQNNPPLDTSDGEQPICEECNIHFDNAAAIKEHFNSNHNAKDSTRGSEDIRSNAKFNSDKGRRSLTKNVPEKSLSG